jgi:hypothetical protein
MAHRPDSLVIRNRVELKNDVQKEMFLSILEKVHTVRVAIKISGLSNYLVYGWRNEDAAFRNAWDEAIAYSAEALESAAYLKLVDVYSDKRRKISAPEERLTEFLLSGMKPDKYKQRGIEIDNSTNVSNLTIDWATVPQAIFDAFQRNEITLEDVYQQTLLLNAQQKTSVNDTEV